MTKEELVLKKVSAISLGCDKNRVDLEKMLFLLSNYGFQIVEDINDANIVIVNTCAFITPAKQEAIENIIKNCIEINPNDIIDIYCEENDFQKKIFIHDHGNGFDIKDLEHLFERFYTSKNSKGFGIGLALTNEIIKGHYGTIEAENDDGALFIITLPKILAKKKY